MIDSDSLPTGRELDASIARHLFGFEVEERTNTRTRERDFVQRTPSGRDWVRVAFYSRSMGASLEVLAELRKRGWTRVDTLWREGSRWNEPGDPTVVLQHETTVDASRRRVRRTWRSVGRPSEP